MTESSFGPWIFKILFVAAVLIAARFTRRTIQKHARRQPRGFEVLEPNTEELIDTSVLTVHQYYYDVRAFGTNGALSGTTPGGTPGGGIGGHSGLSDPTDPTQLSARAISPTSVLLRWTDKSSSELGFVVERNFQQIVTLPPDTEEWTDTSALMDQQYFYDVRAIGIDGRLGGQSNFAQGVARSNSGTADDGPGWYQVTLGEFQNVELSEITGDFRLKDETFVYAENPQDAVTKTITGSLNAKGEYGTYRRYSAPGPGYAVQEMYEDPRDPTGQTFSGKLVIHDLDEPPNYMDFDEANWKVKAERADLKVDSDNQLGFDVPNRSNHGKAQNQIEDDASHLTKLIAVNDDDSDNDGIADFADGLDLDGIPSLDDVAFGERFIPLVIQLPEDIDLGATDLSVRFDYDGSDPLDVVALTDPNSHVTTYTSAAGSLRLWRRPGADARDGHSLWDNGDYITAGTIFDPSLLGFVDGATTMWVEAVAPSTQQADQRITLSIGFNGGNPVEADAVRLTSIDVDLVKTWSDQMPNVAVNFAPGGTGYEGPDYANNAYIARKPYILTGTRADGKIYTKSDFTLTPELPAIRAQLLFRLFTEGQGQIFVTNANGTVQESTVSFAVPPQFINVQDYGHLWGLDFDGDGTLSQAEWLGKEREILKVVTGEAYDAAITALNDGVAAVELFTAWQFRPLSRNFLYAFLNDLGLDGAINFPNGGTVTTGEFKLTHNVGAVFNTQGVAAVNKAVFTVTSGSPLVNTVATSTGIRSLIEPTLLANQQAVRNWFAAPENALASQHTFTFASSHQEVKFIDSQDPDLSTAIGDAVAAGVTVTVTINRTDFGGGQYRLDSTSVNLGGIVTDLYDFDIDLDPPGSLSALNFKGAVVQAGFGTLGNAGHVFKIEAQLAGTPGIPFPFNYTNDV